MNRRFLSCAIAGALLGLFGATAARGETDVSAGLPGPPAHLVRIEARFVDRAGGFEAAWDATGQLLLISAAAENLLAPWRGTREVATSESRQSVTVLPGGSAVLRVGAGVPFAGWFFRYGKRRGYLDTDVEWREVETRLQVDVEARPGEEGVRLALTPEFEYSAGRWRRTVAYADRRAEILLTEGIEMRLAVPRAAEEFYRHFLAGYDPLRRVRTVDVILRATLVRAEETEGRSP